MKTLLVTGGCGFIASHLIIKLLNEYELKETDKFTIERDDKVNGVYFIEVEIGGVKWFNKIILE